MIRLSVSVADIDAIIAAQYTVIRVYTDSSETGNFTTLDGTVTLVAEQTGYTYIDTDGDTATWYKVAYYGAVPGEATKSAAFQGGVVEPYCTPLDVRKDLASATDQAAIGEEYDDLLWAMCIAASELIDTEKRVEYGAYRAPTTDQVRYYSGSGDGKQDIDYLTSLTTLEVEETNDVWTEWTVNTDFFLFPYNAALKRLPYWRLEVNTKGQGTKAYFRAGQRTIKVTGTFGVSDAPPPQLVRAAIIQVSRWYKRAQGGWQDATATIELGQLTYVQELDPDVKRALHSVFPTKKAGI